MATPFNSANELGRAIRRARQDAGLSQKKLGEMLATSGKRVGRWEAGDTSSLGKTPEAQFAVAAQVAAATNDLSLIGFSEPASTDRVTQLEERFDRLTDLIRRIAGDRIDEDEWAALLPQPPTGSQNEAPGHEGVSQ